jgi:DNA-binding NarL/FixJ family response regulator
LSATTSSEHLGTKRVLLVDDHDLFREVLGVVLEHHAGFGKSIHANSLTEARRAIDDDESKADLAVVDLGLPGGEGFTLLEELSGDFPSLPVIGVTASMADGLRARAFEAGASEVLTTSASVEEIVAAAKRQGG